MDIIASFRNLERAEELRETQVRAVAKLLRSLHARYIYRQEADIQRYRRALVDEVGTKARHMAAGHEPTIQSVIERLRRIAEPFVEQAAENGYARALSDLRARGWLRTVRGPVKAPQNVVKSILAENDAYLEGFAQDMRDASISEKALIARTALYAHYLWRASERAYKQCLQDFNSWMKHKRVQESLREADAEDVIQAFFIGPDDDETCDGCDDAVNGNPYTIDDCPEPGEFECASRCRHMVQLDGDAPDDLAPFTWSADLGFDLAADIAAVDAAITPEEPEVEPTVRTPEDIAELSLDELASADLTPSEIAQYMDDNELTLDEIAEYVDVNDMSAITEAYGAIESELPEQDLIDALSDGEVDDAITSLHEHPEWLQFAIEMGRDGLEDDVSAYALADALSDTGVLYEVYLGKDGKWYVVTESDATQLGLRESLREGGVGSGNHGHAGRKGEVGGSAPNLGTHLKRVAAIHQAATHQPGDAATAQAYAALKAETLAQYQMLLDKGVKFNFTDKDPYANSKDMMADAAKGELKVYTGGDLPADHPLAEMNDHYGQTYNNIFRGVHDYNGHFLNNNTFSARGELGAYQAHAQMYSKAALPALAAETLAQNSWVNFYGDHQSMKAQDRPFADQKAYAFPLRIAQPIANGRFPRASAFHEAHTNVQRFDLTGIEEGEDIRRYKPKKLKVREGGVGSGNYNHIGRPGQRGGAGPGTGGLHAQKEAVFMIGGSGSGKGGVIAANYGSYYHMDPDVVKQSEPMYTDKVDALGMHGPGGPTTYEEYMDYPASERAETEQWVQDHTPYKSVADFAAQALHDDNPNGGYQSLGTGLTHELSSAVAKASLIQEIVNGKHNFIFDSTGSRNYMKWADLAQRYGYHVVFHQVHLPEKIAEERNLQRSRTVPEDILHATHAKTREILPGLKDWAANHNVEWRYTSTE